MGECRLETLPGRRVRIEYKLFRLYDPFLILAMLEMRSVWAAEQKYEWADVPVHYVSRSRGGMVSTSIPWP